MSVTGVDAIGFWKRHVNHSCVEPLSVLSSLLAQFCLSFVQVRAPMNMIRG